jgi:hypothetical protein
MSSFVFPALISGDRLEVLGVGEVVIVDGKNHVGKAFLAVRSGDRTALAPRPHAGP